MNEVKWREMMNEVKWIKITVDIFDDEKIKLIETLPEADTIIVIWFKLIALAGKRNDNGLIYLTRDIPFTEETLASIINRPINVVRLAIQTFIKFKMIEIIKDIIVLINWEKHQNIEQLELMKEKNRNRVARHREKQKELCNVTVIKCNGIEENRIEENRIDNINILSSDKSDNSPPVFENPIKPKKQDKKETLYDTHTWNDIVKIYDQLHSCNGGGLINWKQEVRALKDIITMLYPVIDETLPLISALYQVYFWVSKNDFVKKTKIDLTPNRLIKFISDETKENRFLDHYELLKKDKSGDYKDYCVNFMSAVEKERFDIEV